MKKIITLLTALILSGCTTYSSMERGDDDEYYLLKNTQLFFVINIPTIDKCTAGDVKMVCESAR